MGANLKGAFLKGANLKGAFLQHNRFTAGWWWIYLSGKMEKTIPAGLGTFLGWYGYR